MVSRSEVEEKESSVWRLTVEIPPDEVSKAADRVYREIAKNLRIPGFRPGHAPLAVVRRWIGEDEFQNRLFQALLPRATEEALSQHQLVPFLLPRYEEVQWSEGEPLRFTAEIVTKPAVQLGDYRGLKIQTISVSVTDEALERALEEVRLDLARYEPTEKPAQQGDRVRVRYQVLREDQDLGLRWQTGTYTVGDRGWTPPLPEQLLGAVRGQAGEFSFAYPDDHHHPDLAGQKVRVIYEVEQVFERILPELTDDLVKAELGLESVEKLREELRAELERRARREAKEAERRQLEEELLKVCSVSVPEPLVRAVAEESLIRTQEDLAKAGMTLSQWLARQGKTVDEYVTEIRPFVERSLKLRFILEAIAEKEQITQKGIDAGAEEGLSEEEIERRQRAMREEKTMEWLLAQAIREPADRSSELKERP
ncbi:MAG: trigger factor [Armatimonadetes bacterium]|nr:trigger factor [Armatimonadota bacterium]MDW8121238.1 trigger factor [Armatimonadota bacterium]